MSTPDWTQWLDSVWGPNTDDGSLQFPIIAVASNVVVGSNPPYTIQDFFGFYPKWGGTPLSVTIATAAGSANVTLSAANSNIAIGNPVSDPSGNIPDNTFVKAISGMTVTLTNPATSTVSAQPLTIYNATILPVAVLAAFIALATASLVEARWQDSWTFAMALFVAHFASLYAKSDGTPTSTIGQIAAQGISTGIQIAKAVGDVSVNYETVKGIEDWGSWNLTTYGQQLAQMARMIGNGTLFLW